MRDLIIVGGGGFGRELHAMLWEVFSPQDYRFKGFLAEEASALTEPLGPTLASPEDYQPAAGDALLLAIGSMAARKKVIASLTDKGGEFISFIHPQAYIAPTANIGEGAVIYPFAVVSNAARLGPCVHLNYYASAGHDAQVGAACLLAPYATLNGMTVLEDHVYLSTHATVVVGRRVGEDSKVSAGSTVQQDVPAGSFVFGVPGRVTRIPAG